MNKNNVSLTQWSKISTLIIIKGEVELEISNLSNAEDLALTLTNEEAATLHNKLAIYLQSLNKVEAVTKKFSCECSDFRETTHVISGKNWKCVNCGEENVIVDNGIKIK